MKHGSLFNGIGGFQLAAQWMGWENTFSCEIDDFCNKVTKKHFPNCKQYGDIKQTDFTIWAGGGIDIITGGDPCQVSSKIGKMEGEKGKLFLWPEYFRCVRESRPFILVNENVDGTISNGILDRKITELESIGYTCWAPVVIPASFVGASHKRDRVWLIAHATEGRLEGRNIGTQEGQWQTKIRPIEALVENKNGTPFPRPEFLRNNDGLPNRVDRIKSLGNAIVPQVALELFLIIDQFIKDNIKNVK